MGKRLKGLFFLLFAGWVCAGAVGAVSVTDAPSYLLPPTSDTSDASSGEIVSAIPFVGQLQALPAFRVSTTSFYRVDSPQKEPVSPRFSVFVQTTSLLARLKIFGLRRSGHDAVSAVYDNGNAFYRLCRLQI